MRGFLYRLRDIWVITGITLIIFVILELIFRVYFLFSSENDPRWSADCYQNAPWAEAYYSEFGACNASSWQSYIYWRRNAFNGDYINVNAEGIRKTVYQHNPSGDYDPMIRIFMFGGSSMWGTGVRDEYTLPSLLGKALTQKGFRVEVTNFGESGYVNTQELIELQLELRRGNIPHIAVFYDGANDLFSTLQQGQAGIPQNEFNRRKEFNTLSEKKRSLLVFFESLKTLATVRFIQQKINLKPATEHLMDEYDLENLAEETIKIYNENLRIIYALSKVYEFHSVCYWQPLIFNKNIRTTYENGEFEKMKWVAPFAELTRNKITDQEVHLKNFNFYDLSNIFENQAAPVYVDWCHVGENGNTQIAQRMAEHIASACDSVLVKPENAITEGEKTN